MQIRPARIEDANMWRAMRTQLWPDTAPQHGKEIAEYFDNVSIDIVEVLILLSDAAKPIGFIEINIRNFAEGSRESRVPYIEAWFVEPDARGKGGGRALMLEAERWAKLQGFKELASDTEIDNVYSIKLHKSLGYEEKDRVVCFLKKI